MLELVGLHGGWGPTVINEDVSLDLRMGESVALLGRNGVGKTTLLELIIGRANRRSGQILLEGKDISALSIHRRAIAGIGFVPQNREVFPSLTVNEHISIALRPGQWTPDALYETFPSLAARKNSMALHLSGGEQQMLAIARALAGNPRVILMDEPSEGLAPIVVELLVAVMQKLVRDGNIGLLLVEQKVQLAADLSDRCLVMERGRITNAFESADIREGRIDPHSILAIQ
jgi:branched-chain amino acid transport system ATP-binding protein